MLSRIFIIYLSFCIVFNCHADHSNRFIYLKIGTGCLNFKDKDGLFIDICSSCRS